MGYKVKWVEEKLGVSRKALRNFEKLGLMPPNENGRYRDYSDKDIERIWTIRLFQGMGFSLKEIVNIEGCDDFDFYTSLDKKIKELEEEKAKIEKHIGYAQQIKLTGRFPSRPTNLGTIPFEEFHEKSLNEWNINSDHQAKKYAELANLILNTPEEDLQDTDIGKVFEFLQELMEKISNIDSFMMEKVIPLEILKRKENGPADAEIQLLVKILYDTRISSFQEVGAMTKEQFARLESSSYIYGDVARMKEREYGKEGCLFIADAIAVFGGYGSYEEVEN